MSDSLRNQISDMFGSDTILFEGCDAAIIGISNSVNSTGQVIYSHEKLVDVFIAQGMSEEDAMEWVEFNVVGAGIKNGPIVMFPVEGFT